MKNEYMPMMLRLSKKEEKILTEKCVEINKILINEGCQPVKNSELLHLILNDVIKRIKINKRNEIEVN